MAPIVLFDPHRRSPFDRSEPWMSQERRDAGHSARLLERLLGRRTDALPNFLANIRIVLRHFQDRVVFLHREALVGDSPFQGIDGLIQNALLIIVGRRRYPLLIVLLETGHPLDGGCRRVKLLVRDVRRLLGETGRRRLDLSVCWGTKTPAASSKIAAARRIKTRIIASF